MKRLAILFAFTGPLLAGWLILSLWAGRRVLPPILLQAPLPRRGAGEAAELRASLLPPGGSWECRSIPGGQGVPLDVWRLRRAESRGVVILLHGFGDDAWGIAPLLKSFPDWDAVCFTFRGRDRDPATPSTLGAWERLDVEAVVEDLERQGLPRRRMVLAAASQGSGVALLALADLERAGGPLGGALLECPFEDLRQAARSHLRQALGFLEPLSRLAQSIALREAGRRAAFDPGSVSPREAARGLRTPIALLTGDQDPVTPLEGVRSIARSHPDLTIVPGAGHCEAGARVQGGWRTWAGERLRRWRLEE